MQTIVRCKFGLNMQLCNIQKICGCADEQTVRLAFGTHSEGNKDFQISVYVCKLSRQSPAIRKMCFQDDETLFPMMTLSSKIVSLQSSWGIAGEGRPGGLEFKTSVQSYSAYLQKRFHIHFDEIFPM